MELTEMEVQQLILGGLVVKVSNRKKPDQSLKYSCKFCIWYNHDTNGQVFFHFEIKEENKFYHLGETQELWKERRDQEASYATSEI